MSSEPTPRRDLMIVDSDPPAQRTTAPIALNWTREDLDALKATIGANLTDAEFKVFIAGAKHLGLDPTIRQVVPIKQEGRVTLQITIDGFRLVSERSGKYAGMLGPYWCGADGVWHDVWLSDQPPVAAKVGILRRDFSEPTWGVARFKSYNKGSYTWKQYPDVMLAKVAESLARRIAFPYELSGAYGEDELRDGTDGMPVADASQRALEEQWANSPDEAAYARLHERAMQLGVSEQRWREAKAHYKGDTAGISAWLNKVAATRQQMPEDAVATAQQEPAPAGWDAPDVADEPGATDKQWASIEKLCAALGRPLPDTPLSYNEARQLVSALSQAYQRERRHAPAAESDPLLDAVMADVELRRRLNALGWKTVEQVAEFVADARRRGTQTLDDALAVLGQIEAEAQRAAANAPSLEGLQTGAIVP